MANTYKFHALITTYEVIISDIEELREIDWRVAVIDEAHRLKNRNCKLLQGLSCFELVCNPLPPSTPYIAEGVCTCTPLRYVSFALTLTPRGKWSMGCRD